MTEIPKHRHAVTTRSADPQVIDRGVKPKRKPAARPKAKAPAKPKPAPAPAPANLPADPGA